MKNVVKTRTIFFPTDTANELILTFQKQMFDILITTLLIKVMYV